jgi:phage-related holin
MPISGIIFLVGFLILIDTITGIWKAKKLKQPITSRKLSAIISKLALYEVAVIMLYLIDFWILDAIVLKFFSVPLMVTKITALTLCSIELISISENYKIIYGLNIWESLKLLLKRGAELKDDVDKIKK